MSGQQIQLLRRPSRSGERQKLIGVSFYVIAAYVGFEAVRSLLAGEHPEASWVGIGLAAVTPVTMPPLACSLSGPEQAGRGEELEDGYEFLFPGSGEWAARLTELIVFERGCCPFFVFELVFQPDGGPIRLRVRGPEGVKGVVAETFAGRAG